MNIPILMYHEIIDSGKDNAELLRVMQRSYFVDAALFEAHLKMLKKEGFTSVPLRDVAAFIKNPLSVVLPKRPIVITFDDGYAGNHSFALPLLKQYGFSAVFFIAVNLVGKPFMMTWEEISELARNGMSIQSHTMSHRFLKQLGPVDIYRELGESKAVLESKTHAKVEFLSLPHGSYGPHYRSTAIKAGYLGGCCSDAGFNTGKTDVYLLRRIHASGSMNLETFRKIVLGQGYYIWLLSLTKRIKTGIRAMMGENLYTRVYRLIFNVKEQSHGQ